MNEVRITGRLTREPEIKQLGDATLAVAPLVINDGYKTPTGEHREATTFVDVQLWGEDATRVAALKKAKRCSLSVPCDNANGRTVKRALSGPSSMSKLGNGRQLSAKQSSKPRRLQGWNDEPGFSHRLLTRIQRPEVVPAGLFRRIDNGNRRSPIRDPKS